MAFSWFTMFSSAYFFPLALFFVVLNSLGSFLWFSKIMSHLLDHQKVLKIVGHVSMIIFGLAFCTAFWSSITIVCLPHWVKVIQSSLVIFHPTVCRACPEIYPVCCLSYTFLICHICWTNPLSLWDSNLSEIAICENNSVWKLTGMQMKTKRPNLFR